MCHHTIDVMVRASDTQDVRELSLLVGECLVRHVGQVVIDGETWERFQFQGEGHGNRAVVRDCE